MDDKSKFILKIIGLEFNELSDLEGLIILREQLLSYAKYDEIKVILPELKKKYSSSFMTSLQKNAEIIQKWPLLNFVRQILNTYGYKMVPIRKADGYTLDGVKKYKRFFKITQKNNSKQIIFSNDKNCENNESEFC